MQKSLRVRDLHLIAIRLVLLNSYFIREGKSPFGVIRDLGMDVPPSKEGGGFKFGLALELVESFFLMRIGGQKRVLWRLLGFSTLFAPLPSRLRPQNTPEYNFQKTR